MPARARAPRKLCTAKPIPLSSNNIVCSHPFLPSATSQAAEAQTCVEAAEKAVPRGRNVHRFLEATCTVAHIPMAHTAASGVRSGAGCRRGWSLASLCRGAAGATARPSRAAAEPHGRTRQAITARCSTASGGPHPAASARSAAAETVPWLPLQPPYSYHVRPCAAARSLLSARTTTAEHREIVRRVWVLPPMQASSAVRAHLRRRQPRRPSPGSSLQACHRCGV
jgi:hypothetical protein